ncbi:PKD domain-containing protein [Aquimarina megaterium]|uniref:PKD domain-containing protein n=1 Tax=Aquimarina megaterium TaxID=1443666 RepID=UPI0004724485|nr:PKD domain-containing protein [Aquimarina megaterium]
MKHLITTVAFLLLGLIVLGQAEPSPAQPPQIFPTSPEAASLGKYGEIPVNLSTGRINHGIPLHTINEAGFSLPISLSYNYAGLQVEAIPGAVGLGWDFIGKGMITRQIRGLPDESPLGYVGPNAIGQKVYQFHTNKDGMSNADKNALVRGAVSGKWDTESDKYIISVGSLSATFYLNHNDEAVFAPYKNYKLTRLPNNGGFELIDDSGIKYYFNDKEETTTENGDHIQVYTSAWVINKIVLPNTKEITFTYVNQHTRQKVHSDTWVTAAPTYDSDYCQAKPNLIGLFKSETLSNTQGLSISTITTPSETVTFDYTILNSAPEGQNPVTLDGIKIKNTVGQDIMQYAFAYDDKTIKRKLLTAIHKGKHTPNTQRNYYTFEYFDGSHIEIPYYKQDYWGYYNGNTNTSGCLVSSNSNRSPDFNSTRLGALKRIYYPTKGYSEITYAQNQVYGALDTGEIGIEDRLNTPDGLLLKSTDYPDSQFVTETKSITFTPGEIPGQGTYISISYNLRATGGGAEALVKLKKKNVASTVSCVTPGSICNYLYDQLVIELDPKDPIDKDKTIFKLDPGEYELEVYINRPIEPNNPSYAKASVDIKYYKASGSTPTPTYANIPFGGIRVAQVKSCDKEGNCITKTYSYDDEAGKSTGINLSKPIYRTGEIHGYVAKNECAVIKNRSSSSIPLSSYIGSPVLYKSVEEIKVGDNAEDQRTQRLFSGGPDIEEIFPFAPTEKNNWRRGKVLKQKALKKENNLYASIASTTNYHSVIHKNFGALEHLNSYNLKAGQIVFFYDPESVTEYNYTDVPNYFGVKEYINYSEIFPVTSSKQIEVHAGKTITRDITYTYDNQYGQLKTQTYTDSDDKNILTEYTYPYDKSSTVNDALVAQNRITTPIETQTKESSAFVAFQNTEYKDWGNGILLPRMIKTLKGQKSIVNVLQDRLEYQAYDPQGNPLEVSQVDGRHTMYVWGYNNTQPIVKIDNATYTGIPSTASSLITQLQTVSNTEDTAAEEVTMRNLFKDLREHAYFADAQVTGYTYDPLVGPTSMTDLKGYTTFYKYDEMNRLQYALDHDQHIDQQIRYNYQGQQSDILGGVTIQLSASGSVQPNQTVTFTANTSGSGGANLYTWSVDGTQEQCDGTTSFTRSFSSEGTYTVSVIAYNSQTKHRVNTTMTVVVAYPPITIPTVNANYTHVITGTHVNFSATGIGGGTGDLRYEWYVNDVKQASTATTFTYNPGTAGTYNVYSKVIDNISGKSVNSAVRPLHVYNPLNTPTISATTTDIVKGTTINFSANGIGGGSGHRRYEWYVNNVIQSATGTSYSNNFPTAGEYTIKFLVIDDTVSEHFKEGSVIINSYNPMVINVTPGNATLTNANPSVTFNLTKSAGSGHYSTVTWKVWRLSNPSSTYTSNRTGTSFSYGTTDNGEYEIQATVTDTRTNQSVLKTMPVIVSKSSGGGGNGDGNTGEQH